MTVVAEPLKTPFPYPGGKARVADLVWSRLGDVDNYVEPFAGSLAVLMRRPAAHFANGYRVETVNDLNHFIVNFWRAVQHAPDAVVEYVDWPVHEADLHARHKWLMRSEFAQDWRKRMAAEPDHYDAKIAGWWAWGQCCWIGSGWCNDSFTDRIAMPQVGSFRGGHREMTGRPQLADAFDIGRGVNSGANLSIQIPELAVGRGQTATHGEKVGSAKIPDLSGADGGGNGVHSHKTAGTCDARREWLTAWMRRLSDRLRLVRTCYGHWSRVCDSDSTLTRLGTTGVFLDPPYPANRGDDGKKSREANLYATDKGADLDALRDEVRDWCIKWGDDSAIRIAVCGYEGDGYEVLTDAHGWTCASWEASGGYANQRRAGKGKAANAKRERIWFNVSCKPPAATLFDGH